MNSLLFSFSIILYETDVCNSLPYCDIRGLSKNVGRDLILVIGNRLDG